MKTINSQNIDECMQYSYNNKITVSEYASFLRFLILTMKKELPMEILDNSNDRIIKGKLLDFTVNYQEGAEGDNDDLILNVSIDGGEDKQTLTLTSTGKDKVSKDSDSSSRTFYRYYVYAESNEEGYRVTFNRRVTK